MTQHLNDRQLAERLGLSVATIKRYRGNGTGPRYLKIAGGSVRYRVQDIEAWESSRIAA